jgi:hypothetical protein
VGVADVVRRAREVVAEGEKVVLRRPAGEHPGACRAAELQRGAPRQIVVAIGRQRRAVGAASALAAEDL